MLTMGKGRDYHQIKNVSLLETNKQPKQKMLAI